MTIEQTVEIPADHRLTLDLPDEIPAGTAKIELAVYPVSGDVEQRSETAATVPTRIGFLKGRVSVPSDFDIMGQEEITALFEGKA